MSCCGGSWGSKRNQNQSTQPTGVTQNSPIDTLKIRLAKGEISIEEYMRLMDVLQGNDPPQSGSSNIRKMS
ncbi:hypothetical protein ATW55_14715 [Ferroacidibacillus organovorans]|uniref:SHOCT domain-containing protein n=1 Tax=Ferroacidibacillus organovorans TaxID=1765683 RepID=A0A124IW40_9BACL|nr:hypothetical protein ATW55_14715 [Ferroacidibacillus organovorans]